MDLKPIGHAWKTVSSRGINEKALVTVERCEDCGQERQVHYGTLKKEQKDEKM